MLNEFFELNANGNNFKLIIKEYEDEYNSTERWIVDLFINDELSNHYFKNDWNKIHFNVSKFIFVDKSNNYILIPAERSMFIINTLTLNYFLLPETKETPGKFLGNIFKNNRLIILFSFYIFIYDFNTETYEEYLYPYHKIIDFKQFDNKLVFSLLNTTTKEFKTEHIDFLNWGS